MQIPHMCTIAQAVGELRAAGCTTIGETALRRWIREGAIPHVRSGKRVLINMEGLKEFLTSGMATPLPELDISNGIRQVPEKI